MNLSVCSLEEQVGRWEDQRDVKNLMGMYVNHIIMNMDADIFDALWSTRDDVCYGDNDGWYVGPEAVKGYYAAIHDRNVLVAELLQKSSQRRPASGRRRRILVSAPSGTFPWPAR